MHTAVVEVYLIIDQSDVISLNDELVIRVQKEHPPLINCYYQIIMMMTFIQTIMMISVLTGHRHVDLSTDRSPS